MHASSHSLSWCAGVGVLHATAYAIASRSAALDSSASAVYLFCSRNFAQTVLTHAQPFWGKPLV